MHLSIARAIHLFQLSDVGELRFSDQYAAAEFVSHLAQLTERVVAFREIVGVLACQNLLAESVLPGHQDGLIAQLRILKQGSNRIQPESGYTLFIQKRSSAYIAFRTSRFLKLRSGCFL